MNKEELKKVLIELCSEDNYGVWELFWRYRGETGSRPTDTENFFDALSELVKAGILVAYDKKTRRFEMVSLDKDRLRHEIDLVMSDKISDDLYWFGLNDKKG